MHSGHIEDFDHPTFAELVVSKSLNDISGQVGATEHAVNGTKLANSPRDGRIELNK
jgi:hypothetical protein